MVILYNEDDDLLGEKLNNIINEVMLYENPESPWSWAIEESFRCLVKAKSMYEIWRDEEF